MLQHDEPVHLVVGTGESHSVTMFLEESFGYANLDCIDYIKTDPRYFRSAEVTHLQADASKAKEILGWEPKVSFRELVRIMVDSDMEALGLIPPGEGKKILEEKFGDWHRLNMALSKNPSENHYEL